MVRLLGEKFIFFNSLGTTKISKSLKGSVCINVVLLINFPEQFEYFASASNIPKVMKFTDFRIPVLVGWSIFVDF